ncbi:hypothetical protein QFC21_002257 [Naganishia friedmannii]|uniref:Uncharacterized protein n=1 Tax=Naganishia friedmannii TaxID=89922 RepID=A0ACC2VWG6_9TREE|nr:hypothetical protein QFC21_002257 [Naganishia friedmannii]
MTEFVPDQVKATYQSVVGKAGDALSDNVPNPLHSNGHKPQADDGHRNARAEERHTRHPDAPNDIEEFVATQIDGKIDNEKLAKQFPAKEGVWKGFIDWENNPEKKEEATKILEGYVWPSIPEFQLNPLPATNPILLGHRWKAYHKALGPHLADAHEESWKVFKEEKKDNMEDLMKSHITPNNIHYVRNHGGIPTVPNTDVFSIKVGGLVKTPGELFFKDLVDPAKFPQEEMTVTLQCSGTRRVEQIALYPGEGDELLSA